MSGQGKRLEPPSAADRLRASAEAEKKLLRQECAAEKELIKARTRLGKMEIALNQARERYDRRARGVETAAATLLERQRARVAGPEDVPSTEAAPAATEEPVAEAPPVSDASPKPDPVVVSE